MIQRLAVVAALSICWSSGALAWQCPAPPPAGYDWNTEAAKLLKESAAIIDAVVERPFNHKTGVGEVLRATHIWKGPAATTRFKLKDWPTYIDEQGRRYVMPRLAELGFDRAGEKVRVALFGTPGAYYEKPCILLHEPQMIAALARQLGQPNLKPRPLREPSPAK